MVSPYANGRGVHTEALEHILRRGGGQTPPAPNFLYPSTQWPQISQKSRQTIKISWEMSSNCEIFSLKYNNYNYFWAFEYICAVATASTMKVWGKFIPFSFNKFGLKSYQVELVDCLNEGESIKSSSPTKIQPTLRTQLHLYFETVDWYRYNFYVTTWSVTADSGRQAREDMVPTSNLKNYE